MFVYCHINKINNKKYIGVTNANSPQQRFGKNGQKYKGSIFWQKGIEPFGWDNFQHIILAEDLSQNDAFQLQARLINILNLTDIKNGYNNDEGRIIQPNANLDVMANHIVSSRLKANKYFYLDSLNTEYHYTSNTYTIDYLYSLWQKKKIDTDLDCQRGYVWTQQRQQSMWDTLLRGQMIPELHTIRDGMTYQVIDGKQRITTIMKILQDQIPIVKSFANSFTRPLFEEFNLTSIKFSQLPQVLQQKILNTSLRFCQYSNITEIGIMELFRKLNASMALSQFNQGLARNISIRTKFINRLLNLNFISHCFHESDKKKSFDEEALVRFLVLVYNGVCDLTPKNLEKYYSQYTLPVLNTAYRDFYPFLQKLSSTDGDNWKKYPGKNNLIPTALYLLYKNEITLDDFKRLPIILCEKKPPRRGNDLKEKSVQNDCQLLLKLLKT